MAARLRCSATCKHRITTKPVSNDWFKNLAGSALRCDAVEGRPVIPGAEAFSSFCIEDPYRPDWCPLRKKPGRVSRSKKSKKVVESCHTEP